MPDKEKPTTFWNISMHVFVIIINLKWFGKNSYYITLKHDKSNKLKQRSYNYEQIINELKSKFKMQVFLYVILIWKLLK